MGIGGGGVGAEDVGGKETLGKAGMRLSMTLQQLKKILTLPNPKVLIDFLESEKGSGDYTPDLFDLTSANLIKRVGGRVYVRFEVDGTTPLAACPGVNKKRKGAANDFGVFSSIWRKKSKNTLWNGQDMGLMKKMVSILSVDEFIELVGEYMKCPPDTPSVKTLWTFYKTQGKQGGNVWGRLGK